MRAAGRVVLLLGSGGSLLEHLSARGLPALAHFGVRVRREREQPPPELGRVGRAGRQREEEAPDAEQRRT